MAQTKEQKQKSLKEIKENLEKQKAMVFVAYEGLKAADVFNFRKRLKEVGGKLLVVKKTLLNLILKDKKINLNAKDLKGQIGVVFGFEDEISPVKLSYQFSKEKENLKLLAGFFENEVIGSEKVIALAQIPSKEELLGKVVGSLASPISGLANVLQGNLRNFVYLLTNIKK